MANPLLPDPVELRTRMFFVCALYTFMWAFVDVVLYQADVVNALFLLIGIPIVYMMQMLVYHGEQAPTERMPGGVVLIYAFVLGLFYCGLVYAALTLIDILARITRAFPAFMYRHGGLIPLLAYFGSVALIFLTGRILSRFNFLRLTLWTLVIGYAAMVGIYIAIGRIWLTYMNIILSDDIETIQFYASRGLAVVLVWAVGPVGYLWVNRNYTWRLAMEDDDHEDGLDVIA